MTIPLRPLALGSWSALFALSVLWEGWLVPARHTPLFWLAVKGLPLLAMLPGLWRDRPKAYLGACLLALLYFTEGVVLAWALRAAPWALDNARGLAWIEMTLALGFFVSGALHARRRLREG